MKIIQRLMQEDELVSTAKENYATYGDEFWRDTQWIATREQLDIARLQHPEETYRLIKVKREAR